MRILLVSHEASRSGAPRVALLSAKSLAADSHSVRLVSRYRGPLVTEFAATVPTSVEPLPRVRNRLRSGRVTRRLGLLIETLTALMMVLRWRPDLIYINSTAAAIYLRPARWLRRRTLLHVHESGEISAQFLKAAKTAVPPDTILVACSPSVQRELAEILHLGMESVTMLPSVPDGAEVRRLALREIEWAGNADEVVVGCCASAERRKGTDLWVAAAQEIHRALPDRRVRFVWVGETLEQPDLDSIDADIEFVGATANPYAYMRRFDIATLPSRDDPFPLVVLESMLLGRPIVAFDVGGVATQVGDGGIIVPANDVEAFAQAVLELIREPAARCRLGAAACARAEQLYSTEAYADALRSLVANS